MTIIAVMSAKGGVGVSLIASNLALALQELGPCLLFDLQDALHYDDLLLNLEASCSWTDLLPVSAELKTSHIELATATHSSGLSYLKGSMVFAGNITVQSILELLQHLAANFTWLVIDCPKGAHSWTLAALTVCQLSLLVTTPDPPALRATARFLGVVNRADRSKMRLIVNQIYRNHPARVLNIADRMDCRMLIELPIDCPAIAEQVHFGRGISTNGQTPFANAIDQLAKKIEGRYGNLKD